MQMERVASNHKFTEGPVWSREGFLLFSDIPDDRIYIIDAKGKRVFRENSNGANGNTYDAQGRLLTCESRTRRVVRLEKDGSLTVLAERYQGKRLNAPNDIVVRRDGNIYFTDPAFGNQTEGRELDFYGVYRIPPRGELELVARPAGRPNGIALSPNGRVLYVANSDEKNIRAYDLDGKGAASNERVLIDKIDGVPDGMKVDERGNLYVTARAVFVFSPQGKLLASIETPETPANVAFGEADHQTLYITARTSVYRTRVPIRGFLPYAVD